MALAFAGKQGQNGGGTVSDARTGKRFPLELPIKIHKPDAPGESSGVTGNLSAAGVYSSNHREIYGLSAAAYASPRH